MCGRVLVVAVVAGFLPLAGTSTCGTCGEMVSGSAYNGGDFLPSGGPCPEWWPSLEAGDCEPIKTQPALIFDSAEDCCIFCIEHNRRGLQPPCTHASFGPTSTGTEHVCYAKTGVPPKLEPSHHPRQSFLAGKPCPIYEPPAREWGVTFLLVLAFVTVVYLAGGMRLGTRRHPHHQAWRQLLGLVVDGCAFARGGGGSSADKEASRGDKEALGASLLPASGASDAPAPNQAARGPTSSLHQAVATYSARTFPGS